MNQFKKIIVPTLEYIVFYWLFSFFYYIYQGGDVITALLQWLAGEWRAFLGQPFWSTRYWFVTTYVFLLFLAPFIDILWKNINDQYKFKLCIVLFLVDLIVTFDNCNGNGYIATDIWVFISIFFFTRYIRDTKTIFFSRHRGFTLMSVCILMLAVILSNTFDVLKNKSFLYSLIGYMGRHSLIMIIVAVLLFQCFLNISIQGDVICRIIFGLSSLMFGVYLFHGGNIFDIKPFLIDIFDINSDNIAFLKLAFSIFAIGCLVEILRKKITYLMSLLLVKIKGDLCK